MIEIKEISTDEIDDFWERQFMYLICDGIILTQEDSEYFQSNEYRLIIQNHMQRDIDKHHLIYFVENGVEIGAASYCTYKSEDGKCFILDFWIFFQYRNHGKGHKCFETLKKYTQEDGALYYEINCDGRKDRMNFWTSLGFIENGYDEYDVKLLIKENKFN